MSAKVARSDARARRVSLHIDRLVIDGFALQSGQAHHVRAALVRELTRLIETRGVQADSGAAVPRLRAPAIRLSPAAKTAEIGRRVAGSIHQSLNEFR